MLLLGMVLRVIRLQGKAQLEELGKMLDFISTVPEHIMPEVRTILKDFERDGGAWEFARLPGSMDQLPSDLILEQIRAKV